MRLSTNSVCSLLLAGAVVATALAAGAGNAQAQRRDSFSELRASLDGLFSPHRRTRRAKSKQARTPANEAAKPSTASPEAESSKASAGAGRQSAERPPAAAPPPPPPEKSARRERESGRRSAQPAAAAPARQAATPRDAQRDIGGATPPPPTKRAFGDPPKVSGSTADRPGAPAPAGREQAKGPDGRVAGLPPPTKRDAADRDKDKAQEAAEPEVPEPPPPPSACQQRFAAGEGNAVATIHPRLSVGQCVVDDVVRLEAVTGRDGRRIAVAPAATLRCPMAEALVQWLRDDVAPVAREVGAELKSIATDTSFECRSRNHVKGAKLSEHGHANAVDLRGMALTDGTMFRFTDPHADRDAREALRKTACARFTTVLGPGSDGYHEDHIHLDLAQRRSGYRLCQWDVRDPTVAVIPMPPERPPSAPPRTARARN